MNDCFVNSDGVDDDDDGASDGGLNCAIRASDGTIDCAIHTSDGTLYCAIHAPPSNCFTNFYCPRKLSNEANKIINNDVWSIYH